MWRTGLILDSTTYVLSFYGKPNETNYLEFTFGVILETEFGATCNVLFDIVNESVLNTLVPRPYFQNPNQYQLALHSFILPTLM